MDGHLESKFLENVSESKIDCFIRVGDAGDKGRGVFAGKNFSAGDIIAKDPVLLISLNDLEVIKGTKLQNYYWHWGDVAAIMFGLGSLMNHADDPNVNFYPDFESQVMIFIACQEIAVNQEILIDYRKNVKIESV